MMNEYDILFQKSTCLYGYTMYHRYQKHDWKNYEEGKKVPIVKITGDTLSFKVKKNMKKQIYKIGDTFISIIGTQAIKVKDIGKVIDDLRKISNKVSLQAIDANVVYGIEHLIEVLKVTLEAERRKIMIANSPETDLLLRLSYTNQISVALKYGGLKNNICGCFVIFSKDKNQLLKVRNNIESLFEVNNTILKSSKTKGKMISYNIGLISNKIFNDPTFMRYLLERASLITK